MGLVLRGSFDHLTGESEGQRREDARDSALGEPWRQIRKLQGKAGADDPVFRSRKSDPLDPSAIYRLSIC